MSDRGLVFHRTGLNKDCIIPFLHRIAPKRRKNPSRPAGAVIKQELRHMARTMDISPFNPAFDQPGELMGTQSLKGRDLARMANNDNDCAVDQNLQRRIRQQIRRLGDFHPILFAGIRHDSLFNRWDEIRGIDR